MRRQILLGHLPAESGHECNGGSLGWISRPLDRLSSLVFNQPFYKRSREEGEASTASRKSQWRLFPSSMPSSTSEDQAVGPSPYLFEGLAEESHFLKVHGEAGRHGWTEGLCSDDVVTLPGSGCNGSPRSQGRSGAAGSDSGHSRTGGIGLRQMGSRVSSFSSRRPPPVHLYLESLIDKPKIEIFCTAICPQPWATTALAFVKEQDVIATRRAETAGAKKGGGASQEQPEEGDNPSRKTRFPKRPKKGGDKEAQ